MGITPGNKTDWYRDKVKPKWEKVHMWATAGWPDAKIAKACGVTPETFKRYQTQHEELVEHLRSAREDTIADVEHALLKRAKGFEHTETTRERKWNEETSEYEFVTTKKVKKVVAPDTNAASYYLEQRAPERWARNPSAPLDIASVNAGIASLAGLINGAVEERRIGDEEEDDA